MLSLILRCVKTAVLLEVHEQPNWLAVLQLQSPLKRCCCRRGQRPVVAIPIGDVTDAADATDAVGEVYIRNASLICLCPQCRGAATAAGVVTAVAVAPIVCAIAVASFACNNSNRSGSSSSTTNTPPHLMETPVQQQGTEVLLTGPCLYTYFGCFFSCLAAAVVIVLVRVAIVAIVGDFVVAAVPGAADFVAAT